MSGQDRVNPKTILEGVLKKIGNRDVLDIFVQRLSFSELQSFLLEVYRRKVRQLDAAQLLRQYEQNRFVRPSSFSAQEISDYEQVASSLLPSGFMWIELSPVTQLGASSVFGPVDQNKVLTTIRNTEVVSDSTNAMALECASQRRRLLRGDPRSQQEIKLASSHRMLRTQRTGIPGPNQHFRIFALCTAGRSGRAHQFELDSLVDHLDFYLRFIEEMSRKKKADSVEVSLIVNILDSAIKQRTIESKIRDPLREKFRQIGKFSIFPSSTYDAHYYRSLSFQIALRRERGRHLPVANGGFQDWTQQMLSNKKEWLLASGLFFEQLAGLFAELGAERQ